MIQAKNPSEVIVWKVPGAVHTGAHKAAPQEFERRSLGMVRGALVDGRTNECPTIEMKAES